MESLTGLIEALKTGGPYAVAALFILGWWIERKDRREKDAHLRSLYEKTVVMVQEHTRASDRMHSALQALKEAIQSMNGRSR